MFNLLDMAKDFSFPVNEKTATPVQFYLDAQQLTQFDVVCEIHERTRAQMLRVLIRQAIRTKAAELATIAQELPSIELISLEDARLFLRPYFGGRLISKDTLERRIADGSIVAWKESEGRTATRWILKASLIAWMKRLGKELESEMMP